jgi:hypothetical protein
MLPLPLLLLLGVAQSFSCVTLPLDAVGRESMM